MAGPGRYFLEIVHSTIYLKEKVLARVLEITFNLHVWRLVGVGFLCGEVCNSL